MPHVVFIHGLANKPSPPALLRLWVDALRGMDGLGLDLVAKDVSHEMVYWADVLYSEPSSADEDDPPESAFGETRDLEPGPMPAPPKGLPADEAKFFQAMYRSIEERSEQVRTEIAEQEFDPATGVRAIPLPKSWERKLMGKWVRDAHLYLYDKEFENPGTGKKYRVKAELRSRFLQALERGKARSVPLVVVSHSMGTLIAYDCLKHVVDCPKIDCLVTAGSPLGLSEVQDAWPKDWNKDSGFPQSKVPADRWLNFYDPLDLVCGADPKLKNDYRLAGSKRIQDVRVRNEGAWRHSAHKYLARTRLREKLAEQLGV